MQAYPQDLRHRVLRAIDAGQSQAVVAKTFSVSVATIKRYLNEKWAMSCPKRFPDDLRRKEQCCGPICKRNSKPIPM